MTSSSDSPWGNKPRLLLLGSRGKMATFFKKHFFEEHFEVVGFDLDESVDEALVGKADILWLSVPMQELGNLVQRYGPLLRADAIICDINSLKLEITERYKTLRCQWLSLHPMFGPFVPGLKDEKVIACRNAKSAGVDWLLKRLASAGCQLHETSPEHHDRMMAYIQVLVHFNKMVVARALMEKDNDFLETLDFTSPIYRLELAMIARMFAQTPDLYAHIQTDNPFAEEMRNCFVRHAQELSRCLNTKQTGVVHQLFGEAMEYFHGFSEEGLKLSK